MTSAKLLLAVALFATPRAALADPNDAQAKVGADVLFKEGKQLMAAKKFAEACEKFDASNRLDESTGTLLNLGDCREKTNQLAKAWTAFLQAATVARAKHDASRESVARGRATAIEPRLSYVTFGVPEGSRVTGLVIKRDGSVIDPALWNTPIPVDAGGEEITAEAPGRKPWSTKIDVAGEKQKVTVDVPKLGEIAPVAAPPPVVAPVVPVAPRPEQPPESGGPGTFTSLRKVSVAVGVVGLVGIAGGAVFGLKAKDLEKQSDAICPTTMCGDAHALDLNSQARSKATASNLLLVGGGVAVAGAVVLWIVGAPAHESHGLALVPSVGDGHVGLTFAGGF